MGSLETSNVQNSGSPTEDGAKASSQASLAKTSTEGAPSYATDLFGEAVFESTPLQLEENPKNNPDIRDENNKALEARRANNQTLQANIIGNAERNQFARIDFLSNYTNGITAAEARGLFTPQTMLDKTAFRNALKQASIAEHIPAEADDEIEKETLEHPESLDEGSRMVYYHDVEDSRTELLEGLANHNVWGQPFGPDSHSNPHLSWPEFRELRDEIDDYLAKNPFTVILPFAMEPDTAHLAVRYAGELGKIATGSQSKQDLAEYGNVIPVSANISNTAESRVQTMMNGRNGKLQYQNQILDCIDWQTVCSEFGLPLNQDSNGKFLPPKGTKGLTMLAGLLAAHTRQQLINRYIAFHDTDIHNVDSYDAIRHLAMPFALAENGNLPKSALIAKTGPGRNNESWVNNANIMAADDRSGTGISPTARQMARIASTYIWPLSGERVYWGTDLYEMPLATRMEIETQLNICMAGLTVKHELGKTAQIANPTTKIENGIAGNTREWDMMQVCAAWQGYLLRASSENKNYPHKFTPEQINAFNQDFGGKERDSYHQRVYDGPNKLITSTSGFMLPSVRQIWEDLGAVDEDRLRKVVLG